MSVIDASDGLMLGSRTPYQCARPEQFQRLSFIIANCYKFLCEFINKFGC